MIRCIAIENEPLALEQISRYINKLSCLELVGKFVRAIDALEFLQTNTVDLMLVDIQMPEMSGIDFVKSLSNSPKVIFITGHIEYAIEGFQLDAADYLVKPISFSEFEKSINKTRERYFSSGDYVTSIKYKDKFLFIKSEYKIVRIDIEKICYVGSMRDYIRIHMEGGKAITALLTMKTIMEYLPSDIFMRVHRSYIVNLYKVHIVERNRIVFDDNIYIPISDQYRDEFQKFLDFNFLK